MSACQLDFVRRFGYNQDDLYAKNGSVRAMHHLSLQDIFLAAVWVAGSVGVVYLSGYIYRTCQRHTEYDKRVRRVVISYWALFCVWQACLALDLPVMRSVWIHYAGPLLITTLFLLVLLFPLIQASVKRENQD